MTERQAEIILSLADNGMNVSATAKQIYMHRNTVAYHIDKVRERTGKNPLNFYDLCDLLPIAKRTIETGITCSTETLNALEKIGCIAHGEE